MNFVFPISAAIKSTRGGPLSIVYISLFGRSSILDKMLLSNSMALLISGAGLALKQVTAKMIATLKYETK